MSNHEAHVRTWSKRASEDAETMYFVAKPVWVWSWLYWTMKRLDDLGLPEGYP